MRISLLLLSPVILVGLLIYYAAGKDTWASLDAGNGRTVRIYADRFTDAPAYGIYSEFLEHGSVVAPMHFIGTDFNQEPPYILVPTHDKNLVAVAMKDRPKGIVAVYDYATGERWPGGQGFPREEEIAAALLKRLQTADSNYRLYDWDTNEPPVSDDY